MRDSVVKPDDLVLRLRARDPSALTELYEREGRRAFSLAYRVLRDPAAAEDAVQEAFTQLWARAPSLAATGRIESLLMTMVHRRAVDLVRARRRQGVALPDPDVLAQVDEQAQALFDGVVEAISTEGLRARLRASLYGLPAEQRAVVDAAYFGGLTLREFSEQEGLSLGTVKSRMRLAMEKLAASLRARATR